MSPCEDVLKRQQQENHDSLTLNHVFAASVRGAIETGSSLPHLVEITDFTQDTTTSSLQKSYTETAGWGCFHDSGLDNILTPRRERRSFRPGHSSQNAPAFGLADVGLVDLDLDDLLEKSDDEVDVDVDVSHVPKTCVTTVKQRVSIVENSPVSSQSKQKVPSFKAFTDIVFNPFDDIDQKSVLSDEKKDDAVWAEVASSSVSSASKRERKMSVKSDAGAMARHQTALPVLSPIKESPKKLAKSSIQYHEKKRILEEHLSKKRESSDRKLRTMDRANKVLEGHFESIAKRHTSRRRTRDNSMRLRRSLSPRKNSSQNAQTAQAENNSSSRNIDEISIRKGRSPSPNRKSRLIRKQAETLSSRQDQPPRRSLSPRHRSSTTTHRPSRRTSPQKYRAQVVSEQVTRNVIAEHLESRKKKLQNGDRSIRPRRTFGQTNPARADTSSTTSSSSPTCDP